MVKTLLLFLHIFVLSIYSIAQTNISAGNISGTWTLLNSPYLINGDISIQNDSTLTIEPGVVIEFQGYYSLNVQGTLLAVGNINDTIVFTINDTTEFNNIDTNAGAWNGIDFDFTPELNDSSKLVFCKIEYAKANGLNFSQEKGGAIFIMDYTKIEISDCLFFSNLSKNDGGAIYGQGNLNSTPSIDLVINNSTFINNRVSNTSYGSGGAIASNLNLTLNNVVMRDNYSNNSGALYNLNNTSINSCEFTNNTGYGIYLLSSDFSISNSIFDNNEGGIFFTNDCYGIFESNQVLSNQGIGIELVDNNANQRIQIHNNSIAYNTNGGIHFNNSNSNHVSITSNVISNNSALLGAGISVYAGVDPILIANNVISNNESTGNGGGIYYDNGSNLPAIITNNTIVNNKAITGGGIYVDDFASPEFTNNIIWGNTASGSGNQIARHFTASPTYTFCNIESGNTLNGNINTSPLFISPSTGTGLNFNGLIANWNILFNSPCINNGDPDTTGLNLPLTDFLGNSRIANDTLDIGAYEHTCNNIMGTDVFTACNSFTWIDGNTYTSNNNTAIFTISAGASNGCDSIVLLDLTINNVAYGIDSITTCNSLVWIDGNNYISNNNTANYTILGGATNGCDSVVTLNLMIDSLSASYSFIDNGNGNYSFVNSTTGNFNQTLWAFGDGGLSPFLNPTHTFSANGTYVVLLTINNTLNGNNCSSFYIDTINVTNVINPLQCNAGFVVYTDSTLNNVIVVNSSTGANLSYLWDFGDGNISTLAYPNYTYATAGPFNLCLTVDDGNGCIDTYCDSINNNGLVFKQTGFDVSIIAPPVITNVDNNTSGISQTYTYPNPVIDHLTIVNNGLKIERINIIDITGKVTKEITKGSNLVDVKELPSGVYFIQLIDKEKIVTRKFIKK